MARFHAAGPLLGDYSVQIRLSDSHQLAEQFGWPTNGAPRGALITVQPRFAFSVELDFNAPAGRMVRRA